jgi:ornithine lipid ester-linked acyl 2-hydroxylase
MIGDDDAALVGSEFRVDRSVGVTRAGAVEPSQSFTTAGLEPTMVRPGRVTRFFMAVVAFAERLNLKYSKVGNPPVYDAATLPWVAEIEREWPAMRAELDRVLERQAELPSFQTIATDVRTITKDDHWKTFFLVGFGVRSARNIARCPETWRIVRKVPRAEDGDVLDLRARKASARPSRPL